MNRRELHHVSCSSPVAAPDAINDYDCYWAFLLRFLGDFNGLVDQYEVPGARYGDIATRNFRMRQIFRLRDFLVLFLLSLASSRSRHLRESTKIELELAHEGQPGTG